VCSAPDSALGNRPCSRKHKLGKNLPFRNYPCISLTCRYPLTFYGPSCGGMCAHRKDTQKIKKKRLGEVLYERGQISAADLKKALLDHILSVLWNKA
jgi:hypothetical protein